MTEKNTDAAAVSVAKNKGPAGGNLLGLPIHPENTKVNRENEFKLYPIHG